MTLNDLVRLTHGRITDTGGGNLCVAFTSAQGGRYLVIPDPDTEGAIALTYEDGWDQRDWITVPPGASIYAYLNEARFAPFI